MIDKEHSLLYQIGRLTGTDKSHDSHTSNGLSYLHIYDFYLKHLTEKEINFLEIGVKNGQSHNMWSKYFHHNSNIYGLDIDPRCKSFERDNIKIFIGSQTDPVVMDSILDDCGGELDVIIDDGSHVNDMTIYSFEHLFQSLKPGGIYIIEDLGCSYLEQSLKSHLAYWPGMQYNKDYERLQNPRDRINHFFNDLIKDLDVGEDYDPDLKHHVKHYPKLEWIHFYSKVAVMKKSSEVKQ
jgi:23S rRNA U2552 (ribose-2'-O)-methylase RlmE/FtsJ